MCLKAVWEDKGEVSQETGAGIVSWGKLCRGDHARMLPAKVLK